MIFRRGKKVKEVLNQVLQEMEKTFNEMNHLNPDPFERLIQVCNLISSFQLTSVAGNLWALTEGKKKYEEMGKILIGIFNLFFEVGRYRINRDVTNPNDLSTKYNVCLGGVHGLKVMTIEEIIINKTDLKIGYPPNEIPKEKDCYEVLVDQAKDAVLSITSKFDGFYSSLVDYK